MFPYKETAIIFNTGNFLIGPNERNTNALPMFNLSITHFDLRLYFGLISGTQRVITTLK